MGRSDRMDAGEMKHLPDSCIVSLIVCWELCDLHSFLQLSSGGEFTAGHPRMTAASVINIALQKLGRNQYNDSSRGENQGGTHGRVTETSECESCDWLRERSRSIQGGIVRLQHSRQCVYALSSHSALSFMSTPDLCVRSTLPHLYRPTRPPLFYHLGITLLTLGRSRIP